MRCTLTPAWANKWLNNDKLASKQPAATARKGVAARAALSVMCYSIVDFCHINFSLKKARLVLCQERKGKKADSLSLSLCWVQTKSAFSSVFCRLSSHRFDSIINMFFFGAYAAYPLSLLTYSLSPYLLDAPAFLSSSLPLPLPLCAFGQRIFWENPKIYCCLALTTSLTGRGPKTSPPLPAPAAPPSCWQHKQWARQRPHVSWLPKRAQAVPAPSLSPYINISHSQLCQIVIRNY